MGKSKNISVTKTSEQKVIDTINSFENISGEWAEKTADYLRLGLEGATNTTRAYKSDVKAFEQWCQSQGVTHLPVAVETLAAYVTFLAEEKKVSTIERKLSAIAKLHELKGYEYVAYQKSFRTLMYGIRRKKGIRQKQAPAFTLAAFKQVVTQLDDSVLLTLRDKSILLLGFASACRRSELTSLNIEDLDFRTDCLIVSLKRSKTNQLGDYEEKAIFYSPDPSVCPIRTLQKWIQSLNRQTGPLFVSFRKGDHPTEKRIPDDNIYDVIQKHLGKRFSPHSLRASFVSIAKENGADDGSIMRQTKHKTQVMIRRYTRIEDIKKYNAAMNLGL
ncbi:site-specific integrase [Cytophagaceae bacterium DM2B3-1]|uniref:Site-specific integrase n=1 Tax=Xanthocytophaga flava TaxID=3048013 RepID=A0ABT7CTX8_9BACT|nr:site-specific integrase [Xanthocytophaga flavus]MDJ1472555.1 site-specific integrase [Xanthocytophaga flavus]MDJ1497223.1 site-specific integrase [Xanthocytophaga flavus]